MGDTYPKFKAAVAQVSPIFLDREATIEKACKLMAEASKNGAKLVAFPETYIPGYPHWIWLDAPLANSHFFKKLFEESVIIPSPATEELCIGAKEADIYVVVGVNEKLPTQMGTMWNTNLIIDNNGKLLGKHRKIVPTFGEKMVWASGDGSGLRVWETDIGRIGTLICGNNTHCLYKYALISQGEQIHIANYPNQVESSLWNHIRNGANSLEGKLFTLCSTGTLNSKMIDMLCGDDQKKRSWVEAGHSYSSITHPSGETLVEILDREEIIYADVDISEIITTKQFHDITGHYTRMDVVSLNLCQDEDRPLWFSTRMRAEAPSETIGLNLSNQLMEIKQDYENIREESKRMLELVSQCITELRKNDGP